MCCAPAGSRRCCRSISSATKSSCCASSACRRHLANGHGELVEIVAGRVEGNEQPIETALRESVEEIGVAPSPLVELFSFLPTPGLTDEEITLCLGIVDAAQVPERAGAPAEREVTRPLRVPIDAALAALAEGTMRNGVLIMALQWLALNRARFARSCGRVWQGPDGRDPAGHHWT